MKIKKTDLFRSRSQTDFFVDVLSGYGTKRYFIKLSRYWRRRWRIRGQGWDDPNARAVLQRRSPRFSRRISEKSRCQSTAQKMFGICQTFIIAPGIFQAKTFTRFKVRDGRLGLANQVIESCDGVFFCIGVSLLVDE
jgi:hypothetical protein